MNQISKEYLEQIGYKPHELRVKRRKILQNGVKQIGYKSLMIRLNALLKRYKHKPAEHVHQIKEDLIWLKLVHRT